MPPPDETSAWATFGLSFTTIFLAELGDKTQLATLGLAAKTGRPLAVFLGAALALAASAGLAAPLGAVLNSRLDPRWIHYGAATLFLGLGLLMLIRGPES